MGTICNITTRTDEQAINCMLGGCPIRNLFNRPRSAETLKYHLPRHRGTPDQRLDHFQRGEMKNITHQHRLGYEDSGYLDVIGQHMGHQLQEWANGDVNPGRNLPLTSVDNVGHHMAVLIVKLGTHSPPGGHLACAHAHRHKHMEEYVHHCTSENLYKFDQICTLSHF
jgi:hypothetical protein